MFYNRTYVLVGGVMRYILHCDLNNFYASVECLYDSKIKNKAVVVVGDEEKRHGVVLAKNYIAKKYKIVTGDTVYEARRKCGEELVVIKANFSRYFKISKLIKEFYRSFTKNVESFGIDEAWLDISHFATSFEHAVKFADELRKQVKEIFGLTISVGVSFNKIFAKLGSDMKKPDATTLITDKDFKEKVWRQPVGNLLFVGPTTIKKLATFNINTIGDLANCDIKLIKNILGKMGHKLWIYANGKDVSPVHLFDEDIEIKSIGNSNTCPYDLTNNSEVKSVIYTISESIAEKLRERNLYCSEVQLFIKNDGLEFIERQMHLEYPTNLASNIASAGIFLFEKHFKWDRTIRAVGIRVGKFREELVQESLFLDRDKIRKKEELEKVVDKLREEFGYFIIARGTVLLNKNLWVDFNFNPVHKIFPRGNF